MSSILVVDDQETVRNNILEIIQEKFDFFDVVYQSDNGLTALEIITKMQPDIIVLDIIIPYMTGLELLDKLVNTGISNHVIIISSHANFTFAQKAVEYGVHKYITKPVETKELEKAILDVLGKISKETIHESEHENYRKKAYSYMMFEFLRGNDIYTNINELAEEFGITKQQDDGLTLCVFDNLRWGVELNKLISSCGHKQKYSMLESPNGELLLIAVTTQNSDLNWVFDGLDRKNCKYKCGISTQVKTLYNLPEAYSQSKTALMFSIQSGTAQVHYTSLALKTSIVVSKAECDNFIILLQKAKRQEIFEFIDTIFAKISHDFLNIQQTKQGLSGLINYVSMSLKESWNIDSKDNYIKEKLDSMDNPMEMKLSIKKYYSSLLDDICAAKEQSANDLGHIISKIVLSINENYMHDFSLSDFSEQYHLNYTYLSSLFKKKMNMTFVDYLLQIRLDRAKDLLTKENLKIVEISSKAGFTSPSYFCKMFKKVYNISPAEYRRLH